MRVQQRLGRGWYADHDEADGTGAGGHLGPVRLERNQRHLARFERSIKAIESSGPLVEEFSTRNG